MSIDLILLLDKFYFFPNMVLINSLIAGIAMISAPTTNHR